MKFLFLAGTLGALLLAVLVPSVSQDAYAKIFTIDNFTDDGGVLDMNCDQDVSFPVGQLSPYAGDGGLAQVAGGVRECQLTLLIENSPDTGASNVVAGDKMYRHMSGPGVSTMSYLQYDGTDNAPTMGVRALSLDLTNSDNLQLDYSFSDFTVNVTATLIDGDGDSASIKKQLAQGTSSLTNIKWDLDDFVIENGALSLGDIDEIAFNFTNTVVATDFTLEKIHITMVMVGGEMYPADTTALLLAGAELNAMWILPVVAAIGIGAFIVTRKR